MSRARPRLPSPALVLAGLALVVASGGTAYAAAASVVSIADPTTPANKAGVTAAGLLKTTTVISSGSVGQALPAKPFSVAANVSLSEATTLIGWNKATSGLTRVEISNYYEQEGPVRVTLWLYSGGTSCENPTAGTLLGQWGVPAAQTSSEEFTMPLTLAPLSAGASWCLVATASLGVSNPGYQTPPLVVVDGFVQSGNLPAGATSSLLPTPAAARNRS